MVSSLPALARGPLFVAQALLFTPVRVPVRRSAAASMNAPDISARARQLHFSSLVVDTHADTTQRFLGGNFASDGSFHSDLIFDFAARDPRGSVDIPRMRAGGLNALFFSIWVPSKVKGPPAVKRALEQIAAVHEQLRLHPADLALATTAEEIRSAHRQDKISVLIGIEGGHMINSDLAVLRQFAAQGARYMTLTHSGNVEWADSSGATPQHNGLTPFGREVIHEMNRLRMMVDISHVSDKTFHDVLSINQGPLIASHSSCRAICDAPRNMSDAMIKALAAKGGVIQINYHVAFLSQEFRDAEKRNPKINQAIEAEVHRRCGDNEACELIEGDRLTREYVEQGKLPRVDWSKIIGHIDHAVNLVGPDHVGLGSDFDGANMPYGMEDVSQVPKITEGLLRKGYSEDDVEDFGRKYLTPYGRGRTHQPSPAFGASKVVQVQTPWQQRRREKMSKATAMFLAASFALATLASAQTPPQTSDSGASKPATHKLAMAAHFNPRPSASRAAESSGPGHLRGEVHHHQRRFHRHRHARLGPARCRPLLQSRQASFL